MSKVLYFVDSIHYHPEGETASVSLLSTELNGNEIVRVITLSSEQLVLRGLRWHLKEGWYVYYDNEESEYPFTYGNRSRFAQEQFDLYYESLSGLAKRFLVPGNSPKDEQVKQLAKSKTTNVRSFHVNVGHGCCSFILMQDNGFYLLWAIDCSILDMSNRKSYSSNLISCLDKIASDVGLSSRDGLHIDRFFLTHPHFDHFNGMEYLINNGHIDSNTICYVNWEYQMASPTFNRIMRTLNGLGVWSVEPLVQNSISGISFLHPECHIYRHPKTVVAPKTPNRMEGKANNASAAIHFKLGNRNMLFPGDLEKKGFGKLVCRGQMCGMDYYAISHHGSLNGHPDVSLSCHSHGKTCLSCLRTGVSKVLLMGRDGAYQGIYDHSTVIGFFSSIPNCLVYTEKDSLGKSIKFVELNWGNGKVRYFH